MPLISLPDVKCPNMRTLRTSTRFVLPFTVSSVTRSKWPSLDVQPSDYGLGKSPSAPEPKGSPGGIADPDPDFSLKAKAEFG